MNKYLVILEDGQKITIEAEEAHAPGRKTIIADGVTINTGLHIMAFKKEELPKAHMNIEAVLKEEIKSAPSTAYPVSKDILKYRIDKLYILALLGGRYEDADMLSNIAESGLYEDKAIIEILQRYDDMPAIDKIVKYAKNISAAEVRGAYNGYDRVAPDILRMFGICP